MTTTPTTSAKPILSPLNDLLWKQFVEDVDPSTGIKVPVVDVTDGAFSVFVTDDPATGAPPDGSLVGTATHIGVDPAVGDQSPLGTWLYEVDGTVLTQTLCDTLFKTKGKAYLVVMRAGGFKRYIEFKYQSAQAATVTV